ncbi:hypothetical protein EDD80_104103 [Anseongella ginsenosidimutans]|uniref:Outer membrane protein with beta-barrel domain n=1 Tax=Anseongella ginsenosidimutans TaxID=496056 RepID=A0A4R3KSJ5_9SPHI|nr:hypothetical protein [Anseongella ginsenosidimutans]QEC53134.1 hypothetical protein FRZ59_12830 [Anseongella ginsenosidimutans]TCS87756.1 hypothetical protein EDD80_104103 [Anseongella ginsenosidimutans]
MSDRLDKELSRHIQAVFDAYDEPFDPANWQRLQRRQRGRVIALYLKRAGIAASVALLLGAGVLLWNRQPAGNDPLLTENDMPASPAGALSPEGTVPPTGENAREEVILPDGAASASGEETDFAGTRSIERSAEKTASLPEQLASVPDRSVSSTEPAVLQKGNPTDEAAVAARAIPQQGSPAREAPSVKTSVSSLAMSADEAAAKGHAATPAQNRREQNTSPDQSGKALAAGKETPPAEVSGRKVLAERSQPAYGEKDVEEARNNRFSVGFVTTSLMNYADGNTANEVHFGAGITSGWKVSDRLSVHSGLILAENSLSLNRSNSSVRASTYAADRAATTELSAVGENRIVQAVSPNSMDVSLLVVDIPLNLTYRVGLGRSDLLLTGGLSSFAYLDQEYSYHNTIQLYTNASVDAPEPVVRDEKAFSHFDLARQLNFAIGTEVPLGKGSVLIVEPYVKYPLGELTSEDIRFGSAGMNLRLSFGNR